MSDSPVLDTDRHLKRTRLSADDTVNSQTHSAGSSFTSSASLQRHPEIWFDDGNIVLVARETAFRIYRGLLAAQSTVFSDMFVSSTSSPDEAFDGCPVVHLSDSPHALAHLLRVLLPKSRIHYHTASVNPVRTFDELSAVIRLAHKYNISQVQEQALASLHELGFPTSFVAYSNPRSESQLALDPWLNIAVVNLARLTDTPSLLPLALYRCTYLGGDILNGWAHEDGTIEHLSEADLRRCVDGRAALMHEDTVFLSDLFDDAVSAGCVQPARCAVNLRHAQHKAVCSEEVALQNGVLRDWAEVVGLLGENGTLCTSCRGELLERNKKGRRKIFDKLPEIFRITVGGWGAEQSEAVAAVAAGDGV